MTRPKTLSKEAVKRFYNRVGEAQDTQKFYEAPALQELIAHAHFETAHAVFEFGCGTGSFAEELLAHHLPSSARYHGVDISPVMVDLATDKLAAYEDRVTVQLSDGSLTFDLPAASFDRYVTNYVADLLAPEEIARLVQEAHRLLTPGGKLCMVSLAHGTGKLSGVVSHLWSIVHEIAPILTGGCRPVELTPFLPAEQWHVDHVGPVTAYAIPSQVLVASKQP